MLKYRVAKPGQAVNLANEISKIQIRAGINVTGELDDATKRLFIIPRCGVPESEDAEQQYSANKRKKRYLLQGTKWQKKVRLTSTISVWSIGSWKLELDSCLSAFHACSKLAQRRRRKRHCKIFLPVILTLLRYQLVKHGKC